MAENKEDKKVPVKPYDASLEDQWILYDNIPYTLDKNLIGENSVKLESGNIIKYFRCSIKDPFEVNND